ncbi:MAG: branched chain amino acid aminotransferase [Chloroflexi bacterium 13_1_40CM_4_68_4]|nr:MAG: branched chain amino acid aminotransferase [Chloroflexi bacterium 13_1_40CM_4_68_4]
MAKQLTRDASLLRKGAAPTSAWAFLNGEFVPIADAKISVMTHAFNYGTGVFEGIRAYWNAKQEQLFVLHLKDHYERMLRSCKIMRIENPYSVAQLSEITLEVLRKCNYHEDAYIRPLAFKSSPLIGVRLHDLEDGFTVFAIPFGTYIDVDRGISCCVSSWRRTDDNAIPARSKITGAYVNAAIAKTEAQLNGYDEAIVLTQDGHVSEGSAENLFMVKAGALVTPPITDNILEGIVRRSLMALATEELGIEVVERSIDRTELYVADEVFLCGTGAQISPVIDIDRRAIGDGRVGSVTTQLSRLYFSAVRGDLPKYRDWVTPVYRRAKAAA